MSDDYRLYLDEKFSNLHKELSEIKNNFKKTNDRITILEKDNNKHYEYCPVNKKLEKIEKEMLEYRFVKKYPKLFLSTYLIFGVLILYKVIIPFIFK